MEHSPTRMLTIALVGTLVGSVAASVATAWAVSDSLEGAGEIARREERTAYLTSAVAVQVSQVRVHLLEAIIEPDERLQARLEEVRRERDALQQTRAALRSILDELELEVWRELEPRLDALLARVDQAAVAIEARDDAHARSLLDETELEADRLAHELDRFRDTSMEETAQAVASIQTSAQRTLRIASIAWLGLVAALGIVWMLILRVVAAQRRALAVKMAGLEAANRELEAFAGRVAHDMRNVLSPIRLGVDAIGSVSTDAYLQRIAERIRRSCERGRDLVDGLLAFSHAAGGTKPFQSTAIATCVADVLDELREPIRAADVRIVTKIPADARVALEHALLHVVLVNVVSNAVKYVQGRPKRQITMAARRTADRWRIEIRDTGPGIPPEELPRVFDALYRGTRSTGGGIGLGLATVKRITESAGGRVDIDSVVDEGTTVSVVLPAGQCVEPGSVRRPEP